MLPSSGWRGLTGRGRNAPSADDDEQPAGHYGPSFKPGEFLPGYPPPGYTPAGAPRWASRRVERLPVRRQILVAMIGAAALLAGSLMNWATGTAAGRPAAVRGTELDGQLTLTLAILVLMFGGLLLWRTILGLCITIALIGALTVVVAVVDVNNVRSGGGSDALLPDVHLSVGIGLWISLVAGIVICAAGAAAALGARRV